MKRFACSIALVLTLGAIAVAQEEGDSGRPFGPPPEVIAAWEAGEGDLLPGPPEWVLALRGGDRSSPGGMPPRVALMYDLTTEIGLPGPPPEVIEAWENGEGESLPGPPGFVFDILQMFWP